jgi:predicted MPP superfamily phosphohydrolase
MSNRALFEKDSAHNFQNENSLDLQAVSFEPFWQLSGVDFDTCHDLSQLNGINLPNLRLVNTVDEESIASRRIDKSQELDKGFYLFRKLITYIDSFWESPESISGGDTRANPEPRVELDPQPYRQFSDKIYLASQKLKKFIAGNSSVAKINRQSNMYYSSVPIENLAPEHEGLKILHLTDIHFSEDRTVHNKLSNKFAKYLNPFCPIKETLDLANYLERSGQKVDIIALTGDVISGSPKDLSHEALSALQLVFKNSGAKFIFYTRGNHDYYSEGTPSAKIVVEKLKTLGVQDITSKHVEIQINGKKMHFIGMDDYSEGQPIPPVSNNTRLSETSILLLHDQSALRSDCAEVDLVLSGHYHGGELYIPYLFDGAWLMKLRGFNENINKQVRFWQQLTERTKSYIGLGSGRHVIFSKLTKPGPSIISLEKSE